MKSILVLFVSLTIISCGESDEFDIQEDLIYGTSFGECIGYCIREITLNGTKGEITARGWNGSVESKTSNFEISNDLKNKIISSIDVEDFKKLPEQIGCPDCADGGAEWIELNVDGEQKRVTFEYGDNIEGINQTLVELRKLSEEYDPVPN